jgi:hypothetical protein
VCHQGPKPQPELHHSQLVSSCCACRLSYLHIELDTQLAATHNWQPIRLRIDCRPAAPVPTQGLPIQPWHVQGGTSMSHSTLCSAETPCSLPCPEACWVHESLSLTGWPPQLNWHSIAWRPPPVWLPPVTSPTHAVLNAASSSQSIHSLPCEGLNFSIQTADCCKQPSRLVKHNHCACLQHLSDSDSELGKCRQAEAQGVLAMPIQFSLSDLTQSPAPQHAVLIASTFATRILKAWQVPPLPAHALLTVVSSSQSLATAARLRPSDSFASLLTGSGPR